MTDRVQPGALGSIGYSFEMAAALGQFSDGWVQPGDESTVAAEVSSRIDPAGLNAFDITTSETSLTVTIDGGEAFVNGWLATDEPTDVTLDPDAETTIAVGWDVGSVFDDAVHDNPDDADEVLFQPVAEFSGAEVHTELWTVTTDADGVVDVVDERTIGPAIQSTSVSADERLDGPTYPTRSDVPDEGGFYAVEDVDGSGEFGVIYRRVE